MDRKKHWEKIYQTKSPAAVSWYQKQPSKSLELIQATGVAKDSNIIDVGGGASLLADYLVETGHKNLWVLDISDAALQETRQRLGKKAEAVHWIAGDVTNVSLSPKFFDVWHDRAVFHFLTREEDRQAYKRILNAALKPNGHLIIATFSQEGPLKCSGLDVVRYSAESLQAEFGHGFRLVESAGEDHRTPFGTHQNFVYCLFRKS